MAGKFNSAFWGRFTMGHRYESPPLPHSNPQPEVPDSSPKNPRWALRRILSHPFFHPALLLLWTAIGLGLRFFHLTEKPLWTDEFSTLAFSLGNGFLTVPLDQILTPDQLLQPLKPNPDLGVYSVVRRLLNESNHPPLYFILTHLWLRLFPTLDGWVSVWGARSLSALFGTLTIPAIFALGQFAFRSRLVGQVAAALMAVSPFGIYLAQEARHYTLPLLWIIASLGCLVAASRAIRNRVPLPMNICLLWIGVNVLGIATHYLVILALLVEAGVVLIMGLVQSWREQGRWYPSAHWWRIVAVAIGTMAGGMVWLPYLQDVQDSRLTQWILNTNRSGLEWLDPVVQSLAGWISMIYLLPVQASSQPIIVLSGAGLILITLWTVPKLYRGLKSYTRQRETRLSVMVLGFYVFLAVLLFFGTTYFLDRDITSAFRYNFVYFPAVVVLVGAGLASVWSGAIQLPQDPNASRWVKFLSTGSCRTVVLIWLFSLLGGLTVVENLGYQKTHRPDVVVQEIRQQSEGNVLIAIAHETHGQTGRLMGIAWELARTDAATPSSLTPRYLLAHVNTQPRSLIKTLRQALRQLPRPLDLWLLNMRDVPDVPLDTLMDQQNCYRATRPQFVDGYRYELYRCLRESNSPQGNEQ